MGSDMEPAIEQDTTAISLTLQDGQQVECSSDQLAKHSQYFQALLQSGMVETQTRSIDLLQLDPRAVTCFLDYVQTQSFPDQPWEGFESWEGEDGACLAETFDYLQVTNETILSAIRILHNPTVIRHECEHFGWVDASSGVVQSLPQGKKKRAWRVWVCYLLCLQALPKPNERMDQIDFTNKLEGLPNCGGAVALRRDIVEYGLVQREGDGSAYWRPTYTVAMACRWLEGMPRRVI